MPSHTERMITFDELLAATPTIATAIRERLESTGLAMLGTLRRDGSPRISPVEVTFLDGGLFIGMMPRSQKALDLLRDPCAALITPVADKRDLSGEGKLFGVARALHAEEATRVLDHAIGQMEGDLSVDDFAGSHVFEILVTGAAWQHASEDEFVTRSWTAAAGERLRRRTGATGLPEDVAPE